MGDRCEFFFSFSSFFLSDATLSRGERIVLGVRAFFASS
jgi:hypothetical protein